MAPAFASCVSRLVMGSLRRFWGSPSRILGGTLVLLMGGLLFGCSSGSFVGQQYNNFTAYYNTFYNAQAAFEKGLQAVNESAPEVDWNRYISLFPEPSAETAGDAFESAIQKSADLLRQYPNSKWVDDALMLIGRSYYYQQNYVGATQKYREIISLNAEREGEARFRLAKTLLATERYADASEALAAALEGDEDFGTWTAQMHLIRGELHARQEQWEDSESALETGLKGSLPDEVGARGAFLLGQVRETREDYRGAQRAYQQVLEYDPRYPLEFAARLSAIEMHGRRGEIDRAFERLESLERGDDTQAMRGQMAVVRARLYRMRGEDASARRVLRGTLAGEEAPRGEVQGELHYELGTLYRDAYEDFTRAAAHFDTAATQLSTQGRTGVGQREEASSPLPRAPSNVQATAEQFRGLAERAQTVSRLDSLLRLGRMDTEEFSAFVEELRRRRLEQQRAQAEREQDRQFQSQTSAPTDRSSQSGGDAVQTRGSDAGFLFHRDPTLVQRGRREFRQRWGDRPLVDNWRRQSDLQSREATAEADAATAQSPQSGAAGSREASEPLVDVSAVPRDSASRAEMEARQAVAEYELGNALFRAVSRPDSAEAWYEQVLAENPDHEVARQALYALAQAYRAQGDTARSRDTYRRVIDEYPGTSYAKRSRQQLGIERVEPDAQVTSSRADSAYAAAYQLWQKRRQKGRALDAFLRVAETYPDTDAAPRALLAAGVVYHQTVQHDSSSAPSWRLAGALDRLRTSDSTATTASTSRGAGASDDTTRVDRPARDSSVVDTTDRSPRPESQPEGMGRDSTSAPALPTQVRPQREDTARVPQDSPTDPDTAAASTDSTRVEDPDSARAPAPNATQESASDSATVSASTRVGRWAPLVPDQVVGRENNAGVDSSLIRFDELMEPLPEWLTGDSTATFLAVWPPSDPPPPDPVAPLRSLLSYLSDQYPDTPEATRARQLLERLPEPGSTASTTDASAAATSATAPARDSTAATRPRASNRTRGGQRIPGDTTQADTTGARPTQSADRPGLQSNSTTGPPRDSGRAPAQADPDEAPSDSVGGSWTLLVESFARDSTAARRRQALQEQLPPRWSARVFADSTASPMQFRVLVGRFDSRAEAGRAKGLLLGSLRQEPEIWQMPDAGPEQRE